MKLGNGRWESTVFNKRLQPTQIALGTTQGATNLLKLEFDYGTNTNNGNVLSQKITVPAVGTEPGFTATQTYSYDSLNRLKDAKEMIGTTETWKQTYKYDRYGNRTFDTSNNNTTTIPSNCQQIVCNPAADPNTNKLISYPYDTAGNLTTDGEGKSFTYDAENKQKKVVNAQQQPLGEYFYDGDGKRVKKKALENGYQVTTIFVYDASGRLVAEYSDLVQPAWAAKTSYLTTDHLGSPRITTDKNGNVISRRDFMPFGEEAFTTQRTQGLGYAADTVRQKFTSYERDNESSLDFAQARMYGYNHGRFTSPDAPFAEQIEDEPQSWNLYVYVGNNPLKYRDPLGLWKEVPCTSGGQNVKCYESDSEDDTYESLAALIGTSGKRLGEFFSNQEIGAGQVFSTEGYFEWLGQSRDRMVDHISDRYTFEPPMAGGISSKAGKGLLSRLWNGTKKLFGFGGKSTATNSRAASYAQYQKLKQLYRKLMAKPEVSDPNLRTWLDDFWRDTATFGNGSPMAAAAQEAVTRQPIGTKFHAQKIKDGVVYLERWLKNNPSASANDRHVAEQLIQSIKDVIQ